MPPPEVKRETVDRGRQVAAPAPPAVEQKASVAYQALEVVRGKRR